MCSDFGIPVGINPIQHNVPDMFVHLEDII